MLRTIIVLIALITCIPESGAQDDFASALLKLEKKAYACKSDTEKAGYYLQKMDLYLQHLSYTGQALGETRRIPFGLLKDRETQNRFLWNAALLSQMNKETDFALFYYNRYKENTGDSSGTSALLEILIHAERDTVAVSAMLRKLTARDTGFSCLSCLNKTASFELKHRGWYVFSSMLVPGLGTALEGYPLKGMNSLLINAAIIYGVVALVQSKDYIAAALIGAGLGLKFYSGNIKLTKRLFYEKEMRKKSLLATQCRQAMEKLLKKYPLQFR
ncbi:MAG: hypothetical protein ACHQRM_12545 [Bacteroidia bacterium]